MDVTRRGHQVIGILSAAWLMTLWPGTVWADKAVMENGDQITGKVLSMAAGKLVLKTPYSDRIVVDWQMVSRLTTDGPLEVTLGEEKLLRGKLVPAVADTLVLQEENQTGTTVLRMADVRGMRTLESDGKWKLEGMIAGGIILQTGNTDKQSYGFDGQMDISRGPHRFGLFTEFNYEKNDNVLTDNNFLINGNYDYLLTKKWFLFTNDRFKRDEFADITAQNAFGVGGGYQFWKSEERNLSFRLGPNYVYQQYSGGQSFLDGGDSRSYPAAYWAIDFNIWAYKHIVQFFHVSSGLLSLQEGQNWNILTRTGLRVPLLWKVFLTFQYNYDYAGEPANGKKPDDGKMVTRLGVKW